MGQAINAITGPVGLLLSMTGRQKSSTTVYVSTSILHVLLNLIMIHFWGMVGAAVATSISIIVCSCSLAWLVKRDMGINPFARPTLDFRLAWRQLRRRGDRNRAE